MEILQRPHPEPWSAVCRGAVHRAKIVHTPAQGPDEAEFNEGVISRKSALNYGIAKFVDFVEGFHKEEDRFHMESVGRVVAINQMVWYVNRVRHDPLRLLVSTDYHARTMTCRIESRLG
jgi:hypothetical protein